MAISGGLGQTCAITSTGGVKCWGDNSFGQLGDGTTTQRLTPVDVVGLSSGAIAIEVSDFHACALTSTGGVKCWGDNTYGQLGDGTTTRRLTPVDVVGLTSGVIAIANGYDHSCALTSSGGVKCWGGNGVGQLGDDTTTQRLAPVDVFGLTSGVMAIGVGNAHTCAVTTAGGVKCWGGNAQGQIGDGTYATRLTPIDVTGLTSGVSSISGGGGFHTCALTTAGEVKCWGANIFGQTGYGTYGMRATASLPVLGIAPISQTVTFGTSPTITVGATGTVTAIGGASGNPVTFSSTTASTCTTSGTTGSTVTGIAIGTCTIAANQSGNANYGATAQVTQNITVGAAPTTTTTTSTSTTSTTTTSSTTTTTQVSNNLDLVPSWNLVGNGVEAPITVASTFNDATKVTTVWKWVTTGSTPGMTYPAWAFYTPVFADGGQAYAASKGYEYLTEIGAAEGFWVNAKAAFSVPLPAGATVQSGSFMPAFNSAGWPGGSHALGHGWSLIATGDSPTPAQFDAALDDIPPAPERPVYTNLTTLWAWDASRTSWYFWAPVLVNNGGLAAYLTSKGYLDFATMPGTLAGRLSPSTGLWVNMP